MIVVVVQQWSLHHLHIIVLASLAVVEVFGKFMQQEHHDVNAVLVVLICSNIALYCYCHTVFGT